MKNKIVILFTLTMMGTCFAVAQNGVLPNDSIGGDFNQSVVVLAPGQFVEDSVGIFRPGYPNLPTIPSGPKAPIRPHYVSLNGHILYAYGQFVGYTLYIINEVNAIVYTAEVWADEQAIVLPEWLTGSLTLVFADDDGGCYYGEIEL